MRIALNDARQSFEKRSNRIVPACPPSRFDDRQARVHHGVPQSRAGPPSLIRARVSSKNRFVKSFDFCTMRTDSAALCCYASSLVISPLRITAAMPSSMLAASSASQLERSKVAPTERSVCTVISVETPLFSHLFTASVKAFAAKSCCASSDFAESFIRFQSYHPQQRSQLPGRRS